MANLSILIFLAIAYSGYYCQDEDEYQNFLSSTYSSDGDKEFYLNKQLRGSEYNFKYKLDNGEFYIGRTYYISGDIYLMFGTNNTLYWVEIDHEENNKDEFTKIGHVAKRDENTVWMKNDYHVYWLAYHEAELHKIPYLTEWDLENICFNRSQSEDKTFNYTISSLNNSRKYNGTTYRETEDPSIQRIHIEDQQEDEVDEIEFTEDELSSNDPFCRGITTPISESIWLGPETIKNINPYLLKCLSDR